MTTSNPPASTPELCPDCQLPLAKGNQDYYTSGVCKSWTHQGRRACNARAVTRLRLDLATLQAETAKLITRNAQLEFDLGKVRGELEGLRAGWSVSNHEAWEQGYVAGAADECDAGHIVTENPFPKPEKKESE